jgi:hypothetical protein
MSTVVDVMIGADLLQQPDDAEDRENGAWNRVSIG